MSNTRRLSVSEQKLIWMQLNQEKISAFAKALDASVPPHNLSAGEIDALIQEAKKHGKKKKNF